MADAAGNKLAADNVKVRLIRERRDYYWNYSANDGWSYHFNEKFLNLNEETVSITKDATAKVSFPVEWGPYRVEVEDPSTGMVSSLRLWAGYRWQDNTDGGAVRPDQVKLALDKPAYNDGDTAKITVTRRLRARVICWSSPVKGRCGGRKSTCLPKANRMTSRWTKMGAPRPVRHRSGDTSR